MELPRKAFALIAMLHLEWGGVASRELIRSQLWEDADEPVKARDSLRTLLAKTRRAERAHGVVYFETRGDAVALGPGGRESDLDSLLAAKEVQSLESAHVLTGLYRQDFLKGIEYDLGTSGHLMVERQRTHLRARLKALLATGAEAIGGAAGEALLRELLEGTPEDESILRRLLIHLKREKGDAAAIAEYRDFTGRLQRDIGTQPSLETLALVAQLAPPAAGGQRQAEFSSSVPDRSVRATGIPRVALLPPPLLLADPTLCALACALVEDVTLRLCRLRTFAMLAPHTARQVAGADPIAAVAPLGATFAAVTSLVPGDHETHALGISFVKLPSREIIFGERFDFDPSQLVQRFADLASAIAHMIDQGIAREELATFRTTGEASAYVHYLRGTQEFALDDLKKLRTARHHFRKALDLKPDYVPALTGVARCLTREAVAFRRDDKELVGKAMALALRGEELDPLDPRPHREKAHASLHLHDIDAALEFLDVALTRARHHADLMADRADVLVHASRHAEALGSIDRAIELNPLPPDVYHWTRGSALFFLGKYEAAVTSLERMASPANRILAASAAMAGDSAKASRHRLIFERERPGATLESVRAFMPSKNSADVDHYIEALKLAGFR